MEWKIKQFSKVNNLTMHTGTSLFLLASERTKELFKFLQEYGYVLSRSEVVNVGNYENILSNEISALLS